MYRKTMQNFRNGTFVGCIMLIIIGESFASTLPTLQSWCSNGINPIQQQCNSSTPCPSELTCINGHCSCIGDMQFSLKWCECKIQAGGYGCTNYANCTEGGFCYHPTRCYRHHCVPRGTPECHCCTGENLRGDRGMCPAADCSKIRGGVSSQFLQNDLTTTLFFIIATVIRMSYFI